MTPAELTQKVWNYTTLDQNNQLKAHWLDCKDNPEDCCQGAKIAKGLNLAKTAWCKLCIKDHIIYDYQDGFFHAAKELNVSIHAFEIALFLCGAHQESFSGEKWPNHPKEVWTRFKMIEHMPTTGEAEEIEGEIFESTDRRILEDIRERHLKAMYPLIAEQLPL